MFRSLALEGGGVRGGLHVGALVALEERMGNLVFPDGIYGCSVGSILATAVAFGMRSSQIRDMFYEHFMLDAFLPPLRLSALTDVVQRKGLFPMDMLESTLYNAFASQGIDLRGKTIQDAPQKLHIMASNMTTRRSTIFAGNIPVIEAIKCSSCLPFIFHPQVLYNNVYLDGAILTGHLAEIVPEDCLILHLSTEAQRIFPGELETMTLSAYMSTMYHSIRRRPTHKLTIWLQNDTIGMLHDITKEDKDTMIEQGLLQTRAFLAKRFPQELQ